MTSEVGSDPPTQKDVHKEGDNNWMAVFQQQNENFLALLKAVVQPSASDINLPDFDPNAGRINANAWITMADICVGSKTLGTSDLMIILNRALKGEASIWLSQISFSEMKWIDFREAFIARFDTAETTAAAMIRMLENKPKEAESYSSYASTWLTNLLSKWQHLSKEEIAVALTMAHISKLKPQVRHVAFTSEIRSRHRMQQELSAIRDEPEQKRFRSGTPPPIIKCFVCGKRGHKAATCSERPQKAHTHLPALGNQTQPHQSKIVCFKCNQVGHIASRCTMRANEVTGGNKRYEEKRVNICEVQMPTGWLNHQDKSYKYQYDSGAECSLVQASISANFIGERFNNDICLVGITQNKIISRQQVQCKIIINGQDLEVLLHIIPEQYLKVHVLLGREILKQGFAARMDANNFCLKKICSIETQANLKVTDNFSLIETDLSEKNKIELIKMLTEFNEFLIEGMPTSRVKTGELKIRLIDPNRTVQRRPYRLAPVERNIMREKISVLLQAKIIRPSSSPFASPALLVKKKDGSYRMCIDFRELNRNTVPDRYPLPLIADQIPRLQGAKFFTHLDCASGFHLIPVEEHSIEYTAFVTQEGQYEYLTMPFGLRNAISVFQRAIANALGDLVHDYVIIYVDDIMIVANDEIQGLERLRTVLCILTKAGFSLNVKKCSFLKNSATFLGFEIEAGEIKPNKNKIIALSGLTPPQTVTEVRQFIGLASYFRQFVESFSRIMAPLHKLTSLTGKLIWKEEHELIRQQIISKLTNEPVLMIFNPDCPIELHTDASSDGYGAILFQIYEGRRRVVAYFSKRTSPAESKYHSYELETLAVVNAIKHFRSYLYGQKFTVVTDCNSLRASQNKIDLTPRVHRWWIFLQCFDFELVYREGKRMMHVDFLSRNIEPKLEAMSWQVGETVKIINLTEISNNWLKAEQERDEEITNIISSLENGNLDENIAKTYVFRAGILHREIQRNHKTKCLPYLPRALRWSVVNNFHESIMHLGVEKTLEKLYDFYWFPKMYRYVTKFIDSCITCKVAKPHVGKIHAEMHPIPKVTVPWHTIHIDVTGKLSGKNDQKEYIFVIIDAFTKFVLLNHTISLDTKSSIKAVIKCAALFGAPTRIIADQGRCFTSQEFHDFCKCKNINLHLIATGSARANGQVERVMSVLKSMLTAVEISKDRSWQEALDDIQLALNCSISNTTKSSPLELMIGKVARPLSLMNSDVETDLNLELIREKASENIVKAGLYDKKRFDLRKSKPNKFLVGEFVLVKNEERNQTKLDAKFKGPFKVIEALDGDRYVIKALDSKRTFKFAHDRLKAMPKIKENDDVFEDNADDKVVDYNVNNNIEDKTASGCVDDEIVVDVIDDDVIMDNEIDD